MYDMLGLRDDELAVAFLTTAGLKLDEIPRFRDCYPTKNGKAIIVYTRTGGSNREEYTDELKALYDKDNFINDYDDEFDCTYMSLEFTPLDRYKKKLVSIVTENPEVSATGAEKFQKIFEALTDSKGEDKE